MELASYILGKKSGGGSTPTGTIDITSNGTVNVTNYATANVNVQPDLETKSVTITENTTTTITPTTGKDGISSVTVTTNVVDPRWATMGFTKPMEISDRGYREALSFANTTWDSALTVIDNAYTGNSSLTYLPLVDSSNVTSAYRAFRGNQALMAVAPIDTSNITNMSQMFNNCYALVSIPVFDTSSIVFAGTQSGGLWKMFENCNALSSQSLDNMLQMCINTTQVPSENRSISYLMGSSRAKYADSDFTSLPHYQEFINAGWSI